MLTFNFPEVNVGDNFPLRFFHFWPGSANKCPDSGSKSSSQCTPPDRCTKEIFILPFLCVNKCKNWTERRMRCTYGRWSVENLLLKYFEQLANRAPPILGGRGRKFQETLRLFGYKLVLQIRRYFLFVETSTWNGQAKNLDPDMIWSPFDPNTSIFAFQVNKRTCKCSRKALTNQTSKHHLAEPF